MSESTDEITQFWTPEQIEDFCNKVETSHLDDPGGFISIHNGVQIIRQLQSDKE